MSVVSTVAPAARLPSPPLRRAATPGRPAAIPWPGWGPTRGRPAAVRLSLSEQVRGGTAGHDRGVSERTARHDPAIRTNRIPYSPDRIEAVPAAAARARRL